MCATCGSNVYFVHSNCGASSTAEGRPENSGSTTKAGPTLAARVLLTVTTGLPRRSVFWLSGHLVPACFHLSCSTSSMREWGSAAGTESRPARFTNMAVGMESLLPARVSVCLQPPSAVTATKESWALSSILYQGRVSRNRTKHGTNSSLVPKRRSDEFDVDVVPSQPGFLLQELLFAHRPCVRGNLLYRADWLSLRGSVGCECAILPISDVCKLVNVQQRRGVVSIPCGTPVPAATAFGHHYETPVGDFTSLSGSIVGATRWEEGNHTESAVSATRLGLSPNRALVRIWCRSSVFASPADVGQVSAAPITLGQTVPRQCSFFSSGGVPLGALRLKADPGKNCREQQEDSDERFQSRRSLPASIQFLGTLRTTQGVWITVNVLWEQHFGSGRSKASGPHVSSPQAMGNGYPHKAPQGMSASPSGSSVGVHSGRKGYHSGSVTGAARLGRSPSTLARTRSLTFSTEYQLSPTQPMTRRSKCK